MAKIFSGPQWVGRFPNSNRIDDLVDPFRSNARKFVAALKTAGATVSINATLRPKERAYLMHWSFCIAREDCDPETVPAMPGVNIEWIHTDTSGNKQMDASKRAAEQMVEGYDIAFRPVLVSRHTQGLAIDMDISWTSAAITIKDAAGNNVAINAGAKDGSNPQLHDVGRTYGVIKLIADPPHWSSDGH
ncbi:MAG TPA: hypothetical protein VMD99_03355 [Terriglobales bacterium]|nr:hypothetical protein [Terriglobales bacterium]